MYDNIYDVMQNRECIVFGGTSDSTEQRIHESCECLWVLCSSFVFIQPIIGWIYLQHTRMAAHLPAGLFLLPAATKNNAAKFFVSLKQNNSEFFIGAP